MVDEFSRECLALEVDTSLCSHRVINVLKRLAVEGRAPKELGLDRGPEFTSLAFEEWARENSIGLGYCSPGRKNENAYIESFNGKLRDECLNMNWFTSLAEARRVIEQWRYEYNFERPHSSLNGLTPAEFAEQHRLKKAA